MIYNIYIDIDIYNDIFNDVIIFNLQNVCFAVWQVTTFQNIDSMLEKVHLVTEGTLIYLRETSDVFIRVRNGWRKLQVLLHYVLSFPALLLKIELWIFLQGWRSMYGKILFFF